MNMLTSILYVGELLRRSLAGSGEQDISATMTGHLVAASSARRFPGRTRQEPCAVQQTFEGHS